MKKEVLNTIYTNIITLMFAIIALSDYNWRLVLVLGIALIVFIMGIFDKRYGGFFE